jgi:hypothetical protein
MDVTAQVLHDWLLKKRPDGAAHEAESCPMCVATASTQEENVAENTLTQEQHEQLLASAVAKAEEAVKTATRAEVDAEVLQLNESLEEAKTALAAKDEEITDLKATIADGEEAERLEAVAVERVGQVKAVASFSEEQIAARREAWAKMDEDEFGAYLEDIKAVAVKPAKEKTAPPTVLDTTRATAGDEGTEKSAIASFFGVEVAAGSQS